MRKYSKKLIDRYIEYMQRKYGIKYSEEMTVEHLDSFARFYTAFSVNGKDRFK